MPSLGEGSERIEGILGFVLSPSPMSPEMTHGSSCVAIRALSPSSVSRCPHASASASSSGTLSIVLILYSILKSFLVSSTFDRLILSSSFRFFYLFINLIRIGSLLLLGFISVERLRDLDRFVFLWISIWFWFSFSFLFLFFKNFNSRLFSSDLI